MPQNSKPDLAFLIPSTPSEGALLLSNLVPVLGVLFWDWSVFNILLMYWAENVVIGLLTVAKMFAWAWKKQVYFALLPIIPFFSVHYGLFAMGHGAIILDVFGKDRPAYAATGGEIEGLSFWLDFLSETFRLDVRSFALSVIAVFVSHALSFVLNFLGRQEYQRYKDLREVMFSPYGRVVALHLVVLVGGFAAQATGQPVWALLMLCGFKTCGDVFAHRREHGKKADRAEGDADIYRGMFTRNARD